MASAANVDQLSDLQDQFITSETGWGEIGINTCAHAPGAKPLPIQIGQKKYASGIGHHANGAIEIALDGEYEQFDAEVGLQPLPGGNGSVVFQVFVDDQKQFDSGLMRAETPAKAVSVSLKGAKVLRLAVTDGGDGINCDCANWADARLTRIAAATRPTVGLFDVAPFAQLMTSDPKRNDGARAGRTQEYHTDDVYLEWPIASANAPVSCIGLNWLERRPLQAVDLVFKSTAPNVKGVILQYWDGQTASQGGWKVAQGDILLHDATAHLVLEHPIVTQKIRWILPTTAAEMQVEGIAAYARTALRTTDISLEIEPRYQLPAKLSIYNGRFAQDPGDLKLVFPNALHVESTITGRWKSQRTQLRFGFGGRGFTVLVDDILQHGPVYVPDYGIFLATASSGMTLEKYKQQIAAKKTILDEVRSMPDQTLAAAMAKVHHPAQDQSPVMLSLACDNHKLIVERNGNIDIPTNPTKADDVVLNPPKGITQIGVKFGDGKITKLTRHLDGGWLPAPVIDVETGAQKFRQRTMVVPGDFGPVAVAEFQFNSSEPAKVFLSFSDPELRHSVVAETSNAKLIQNDSGFEITSANGSATITIPFAKAKGVHVVADPISRLRQYWEGILSHATQIEVPDPLLMKVIRASQVHCLMAARNEDDGKLVQPWISSINYGPLESEANSVIRGMDLLGHDDFARKSFDYFISKYDASGMLTTGYTLMGTGWHLQTLGQHYALYHDSDWMKSVAPKVATACAWIDRQRHKTMQGPDGIAKMPQYGLAPPGVMADWGNYAYYFCLNGYYCAGVREAASALNNIGFAGSTELLGSSIDYRKRIESAFHATQALMPVYPLRDGTWVPGYPSQVNAPGPTNDFFPNEDGNRSWCYDVELGSHQLVPQGVLDPESLDVRWMMNHMEDVQFLQNGWFDFPADENQKDPFDYGGFAKVQPYYCRNAEIYAMRDDVKPFIRSYFNTLPTLLNTEVLSLQEHFNSAGAWNKTHETGYFLSQTRYMLVMEHGDSLWLAPFVTSNWMKNGQKVEVKNAPTKFGPVSYTITSSADKGFIDASVDVPTRQPSQEIVIRLRVPNGRKLKHVTVNGQAHDAFDPAKETITISQPKTPLAIHATFLMSIDTAIELQPEPELPPEKPPVPQPLAYMVQLDGLRALAIASVMLFHYTASARENASGAARAIDEGWDIFAGMGVTLFFVLSGFLITGILLKCRDDLLAGRSSVGWSLRQFYIRRFLRIFPAFYLVIAIAFLFATQNRASIGWHAAYLSNFYFAKQGVMAGPLSPFWSLAVEEQFYLVWPLVVLLTPPRRLPAALVCMVAASILYRLIAVLAGLNDIAVGALPIGCLDALCAGALLAVLGPGRPMLERVGLRVGGFLTIALLIAHLAHPLRRPELVYSRAIIALFSAGLVSGAARGFVGVFGRFLRAAPVVYVGTISYGMYLYHDLTPRAVPYLFLRLGMSPHGALYVVVLILATIVLATLSWFLYEYPINALKRFFPYRGRANPSLR